MSDLVLIIMFLVFGLILAVGFLVEVLKKNKMLKKDNETLIKENEGVKNELEKTWKENAENNKAKETMETGSAVSDFNASIELLRHLTK